MTIEEAINYLAPIADSASDKMHYGEALAVAISALRAQAERENPQPPTNADHIRAMSDEVLAITLMCPNEMGMAEIPCDHSDDKNCYECLLKWLTRTEEEA